MQDAEKSTKAQPAADPSPPKPVGNKDKAKLVAFALAYTLDGAVKRVNKSVYHFVPHCIFGSVASYPDA